MKVKTTKRNSYTRLFVFLKLVGRKVACGCLHRLPLHRYCYSQRYVTKLNKTMIPFKNYNIHEMFIFTVLTLLTRLEKFSNWNIMTFMVQVLQLLKVCCIDQIIQTMYQDFFYACICRLNLFVAVPLSINKYKIDKYFFVYRNFHYRHTKMLIEFVGKN